METILKRQYLSNIEIARAAYHVRITMREFPSVTMYFLISAIISVIYNKDSRICTTYTKYQVPEERHADKTIAI